MAMHVDNILGRWTSDFKAGGLSAIERTLRLQSKHVLYLECNMAELSEGEPRMTVLIDSNMMIHIGHDDP